MNISPWVKRLLTIISVFGLPWGAFSLFFMSVFITINACHSGCTIESFIELLLQHMSRIWVIYLISGFAVGIIVWGLIEFQNKFLMPQKKVLASNENSIQDEVVTGISITHLPQAYPPTRRLGKTKIANPWVVVVDGEHLVSFKQLDKINIPLEPGSHEVFLGFENNKAWWKKGQRSATIQVDIQPGQIQEFTLRWNTKLIVMTQIGILLTLLPLITESLWIYPLLDLIPDAYWDNHPSIVNFIKPILPFHPISGSLILAYMFISYKKLFLEPGTMLLLEAKAPE